MRNKIENKTFSAERALYNIIDTDVENVTFAGIEDGESVLKEIRNCNISYCNFSLRYPLWHAEGFTLTHSTLDELTRAPIWYSNNGKISFTTIKGVKPVRECHNLEISFCTIDTIEFGWKCSNLKIHNTTIHGPYLLLDSKDVSINNFTMSGKYSFQYVKNLHIINSTLDTKDAFWHAENVIVENSTVIGEYLGWYSKNLTFINCHIKGTQPLCYCENLKLINCTMEDTDLSFEYSSVDANVIGHIDSIKNPLSGSIICDSVGQIIFDSTVKECLGKNIIREKKVA